MKKILTVVSISLSLCALAQDADNLVARAKARIDAVSDYEASGRMKTNVAFLKVPVANVTVYFKRPGKLKVKSEKGISFIPKGAVSINMSNILTGDAFTVIDAGEDKVAGMPVKVFKLLPKDDNSDVVLSTIYLDPVKTVILKARTTTKENGTYELELTYGKYVEFGLPDKIVFTFNTKDYKLPKGMTFDFDDGKRVDASEVKNRKGRAEIIFKSYVINKGIPDAVFSK